MCQNIRVNKKHILLLNTNIFHLFRSFFNAKNYKCEKHPFIFALLFVYFAICIYINCFMVHWEFKLGT